MNSDEDKVPIYVHRGMKGKLFVHESDGKVKLKVGLLFGLLLYKRDLRRLRNCYMCFRWLLLAHPCLSYTRWKNIRLRHITTCILA
jgi:hypothetical protein